MAKAFSGLSLSERESYDDKKEGAELLLCNHPPFLLRAIIALSTSLPKCRGTVILTQPI